MTKKEAFHILSEVKLNNCIFPVDEEDCRLEKADAISNMDKIFDLKSVDDYSCLFAVAELFADTDKIELIKNDLLRTSFYKKEEIKEPDWNTKLLVLTAMGDNQLFFSMAMNWVLVAEDSLLSAKETDEDDMPYVRLAAATGNTQFAEKQIGGLGIMFVNYKEKYGVFELGIKLVDNLINEKVRITQKIRIKSSGEVLEMVLNTNGNQFVYSQEFEITDLRNPADGIWYVGKPEVEKLE